MSGNDCTAEVVRGKGKRGQCLKPAKVFLSGEKRLCYWHARQEGRLPFQRAKKLAAFQRFENP